MAKTANVRARLSTLKDQIEYGKQAAAVFNARERKLVLQSALEAAGEMWIEEYLPRRFNKNYMKRAPFNYDPKRRSLKHKIRVALEQGQRPQGGRKRFNFDRLQPLVYKGDMRQAALSGSRVKAMSTAGNIRGYIRIPTAHALRSETRRALTTISKREENRIANVFADTVTKFIEASGAVRTRTGRVSRTGKRTLIGATSSIRTRKLKGLK